MTKTTYDFYDGRGEVPAHQHPNGGGWVDDTAIVRSSAYIGAGAYIRAGADIGKGAYIGAGADIGEGAVIRERAYIREGAVIGEGAYIGAGAYIGKGADKINYAERAKEFQKLWPDVPVVEGLDGKICAVVSAGAGRLNMSAWHTCETTHCRAGWAIHLAGEKGYELEKQIGPDAAGGKIYRVSTGRWPNFYASTTDAMEDICKWGKQGDL